MILGAFALIPRTGSTLLNAILNQRPDVYMPFQSPLIEIMWRNYSLWEDKNLELEMSAAEINGIQNSFTKDVIQVFLNRCTNKPYTIDKHWGWGNSNNLDVYKKIYNKELKLFHIRRSFDDIVESFRKIDYVNLEERINKLSVIFEIQKHTFSKCENNLMIVEYEDWISYPKDVIIEIEDWFGLTHYSYDFTNLELDTSLADKILGNNKMHKLKPLTI